MGLLAEPYGVFELEVDEYLSNLPQWKILLAQALFGFKDEKVVE